MVQKYDPTQYMSDLEKQGYALCPKFTQKLIAKGVTAFYGASWAGASDHREHSFWYFSPRSNGGVTAYVTYDHGTYDCGFLNPDLCEAALKKLDSLSENPTRLEIWKALNKALSEE